MATTPQSGNHSAQESGMTCDVCGQHKTRNQLLPADMVHPPIAALITLEHPGWGATSHICFDDLHLYRNQYLEGLLTQQMGSITSLEKSVVQSMKDHALVTQNLNQEFDQKLTLGQRVADNVASFGGSWKFIISFAVVIMAWIVFNTAILHNTSFDPYPYILLNLVLSCLASLQAPVIMMSQNRQESRDRLRSESDYRINLKAELEIRHLNAKMDLLLNNLWHHLIEIQQVEMEMLEELGIKGTRAPHKVAPPA